jgi:hypothetical protein
MTKTVQRVCPICKTEFTHTYNQGSPRKYCTSCVPPAKQDRRKYIETTICGCGRDYLQVPIGEPCANPIVIRRRARETDAPDQD